MSPFAPLSLGELIEYWTLREDEAGLVAVKHGDSKLAFALLLRFYGRYGRFPRSRGELHPDAVEFMARAVGADQADLAGYDWSGRTIERHRGEIRTHFGFRVCGKEDGAKLAEFLADGVAQRERRPVRRSASDPDFLLRKRSEVGRIDVGQGSDDSFESPVDIDERQVLIPVSGCFREPGPQRGLLVSGAKATTTWSGVKARSPTWRHSRSHQNSFRPSVVGPICSMNGVSRSMSAKARTEPSVAPVSLLVADASAASTRRRTGSVSQSWPLCEMSRYQTGLTPRLRANVFVKARP